ncbi:hypothetical protein ACODT5_00895 [Streptomyces sp. 5.8]|uniref:hypothetical protein n=1 Tax=Streptomyces sp. 5.8 TaxID=3406571 RepID=UPI003BB7F3A3
MTFTGLSAVMSVLVGLLAGGYVAVGSWLEARHEEAHGSGSGESVVGVFAALMIASVIMVVLLGWSAVPWWVAILVGMGTGPALATAAAVIEDLVQQVVRRGRRVAELASTAGLLSGSLSCALLAIGSQISGMGIFAAGIGVWIASSMAVAALLPAPRPGPPQQ